MRTRNNPRDWIRGAADGPLVKRDRSQKRVATSGNQAKKGRPIFGAFFFFALLLSPAVAIATNLPTSASDEAIAPDGMGLRIYPVGLGFRDLRDFRISKSDATPIRLAAPSFTSAANGFDVDHLVSLRIIQTAAIDPPDTVNIISPERTADNGLQAARGIASDRVPGRGVGATGLVALLSVVGAASIRAKAFDSVERDQIGKFVAVVEPEQADKTPRLTVERQLVPAHKIATSLPDDIAGIAWSSDGTKLAAYSEFGNLVTIWDAASGKVVQELHRPGVVDQNVLAFVARDGELVTPNAHPGDNSIAFSVFDVASGRVIRDLPGPEPGAERYTNSARVLAASPDGSLLGVAPGGWNNWLFALYSTQTWQQVAVLPGDRKIRQDTHDLGELSKHWVTHAVFSADGKVLVASYGEDIALYEVPSLRLLRRFPVSLPSEGIAWVSFNPDASLVAIGTGGILAPAPKERVRIFRTSDGEKVDAYPHSGTVPDFIMSGGWSPDGRLIAFVTTLSRTNQLHVWNPSQPSDTGHFIRLNAANVAFSPDGKHLAVTDGPAVEIFHIGQ
jgi:WD40 repeat protein